MFFDMILLITSTQAIIFIHWGYKSVGESGIFTP